MRAACMSPLTLTSCTHDQRQQYPGLRLEQTRHEAVYTSQRGEIEPTHRRFYDRDGNVEGGLAGTAPDPRARRRGVDDPGERTERPPQGRYPGQYPAPTPLCRQAMAHRLHQ